MLIAGVRHLDRTRGRGWLDCPSCHEHASQDVVDAMTFVEALGYRLTPLSRRRDLLCRKCGFRRRATVEELTRLNTGGEPIRRAWMAPMGVAGIAAMALVVFVIARISTTSAVGAGGRVITFAVQSGEGVAPVRFEGPNGWNYDAERDSAPPRLRVSDETGDLYFVLRRLTGEDASLPAIMSNHLADESSLGSSGFPDQPPCLSSGTISARKTSWTTFRYQQNGVQAVQVFYAFSHDNVGYTLSFIAIGNTAFEILPGVLTKVTESLSFTGREPTPSPGAVASASPSPSASPSASPAPSGAPETSPGPSPSATPACQLPKV